MADERIMVSVFRSGKREEMYLYLSRGSSWEDLPQSLVQSFGRPTHVVDLLLRSGLRLARADIDRVMADIREQGFYLQMPPRPELDPFRRGSAGDA